MFIMSMITDRIGRHEVLLPIDNKRFNFRGKRRIVSNIVIFKGRKFSILNKAPVQTSVHCCYSD